MHNLATIFVFASTTLSLLTSAALTNPESELEKRGQPRGIDVSENLGHVNWENHRKSGVDFGYVMATQGNNHQNPWFDDQYSGCRKAGLICGAYHIAAPTKSNARDQANYFFNHGGKWTGDGKTLPGTLVLGYNPNGPLCYDLSPSELVKWARSFSKRYHRLTKRYPVFVITTDWWKTCTDDDSSFSSTTALWQASEGGHPGEWSHATLLEVILPTATKEGHVKWNGSTRSLHRFARGA